MLADVDELHDDEVFDLLCAFEVLEHIRDDQNGTRSLGPPRAAGWPRAGVRTGRARPLGARLTSLVGHLRRYTGADLEALFESVGLDVVAVEHYGFPVAYPLEAARNIVARRRLAREAPGDAATRTAGSGRHLQPPPWAGGFIWWAMAPFRVVQRRFPDRGPGLVGVARRPA